eukprot:746332-Hanusia_phi.AAC.8
MGTDDTKRRRSYAAPPAALLCGIFVLGIGSGVMLTFIAAQIVSRRSGGCLLLCCPCSPPYPLVIEILEVKPQRLRSGLLNAPGTSLTPAEKQKEFWIETISDLPGPRIYILHNILNKEECESLKSLGVMAGMEKALIIPYGGKELVESSTRTNTAAWLEVCCCRCLLVSVSVCACSVQFRSFLLVCVEFITFEADSQYHQDPVVTKLEELLAKVTNTEPENGENLQVDTQKCSAERDGLTDTAQILHYQTSQQFKEHHDYFDPGQAKVSLLAVRSVDFFPSATDPPENFEPGGNRLATAIIYLQNAEEGGETDFMKIDTKVISRLLFAETFSCRWNRSSQKLAARYRADTL